MDTQAATSIGACYGSYEMASVHGRAVDEGDRARVVRSGGGWGPLPWRHPLRVSRLPVARFHRSPRGKDALNP